MLYSYREIHFVSDAKYLFIAKSLMNSLLPTNFIITFCIFFIFFTCPIAQVTYNVHYLYEPNFYLSRTFGLPQMLSPEYV